MFCCHLNRSSNLLTCFVCFLQMMRRSNVVSLQRQCCNQICQCGVAITECAIHQLPVHMAPALLIAAIRAQKRDVASCIVSNWPLPTLRYVCLGIIIIIIIIITTTITNIIITFTFGKYNTEEVQKLLLLCM